MINTRLVMSASAILMIAAGIFLTFAPDEMVRWMNLSIDKRINLMLQVIGALYFAFGMINWTARANLIGGIYGRPIAIGNVTHFVTAALALVKSDQWSTGQWPALVFIGLYVLFAVLFGVILFTHPVKEDPAAA